MIGIDKFLCLASEALTSEDNNVLLSKLKLTGFDVGWDDDRFMIEYPYLKGIRFGVKDKDNDAMSNKYSFWYKFASYCVKYKDDKFKYRIEVKPFELEIDDLSKVLNLVRSEFLDTDSSLFLFSENGASYFLKINPYSKRGLNFIIQGKSNDDIVFLLPISGELNQYEGFSKDPDGRTVFVFRNINDRISQEVCIKIKLETFDISSLTYKAKRLQV